MNKEKQSVRRRIFVSNTYMVLVILSLFLFVNIFVLKLYENTFKSNMISATELASHTEQIKSIIKQWQSSSEAIEITKLATQLETYNSFLAIELDGELIYSNTDFSMEDLNKEIGKYIKDDGEVHIYVQNYMTLITKHDLGKKIKVYALAGEYKQWWNESDSYTNLLLIIIIDGVIFIGVLLIVSRSFTKKLIRHILQPLNALIDGSKRMKEGNLSESVNYSGDIEFENVVDVFNQMQAHTKKVNEEKEAYEKARIDMITGISHDLRTPLTAIRGTIKGIQDGITTTPEKTEKFLDIAYRRTIEMDHLLERLFYFSKLETGNMPLNLSQTNWKEFLETYVDQYNTSEEKEKISLKLLEVDQGLESNIDKAQFKRILDNLLENSKKYGSTNSLEVTITSYAEDTNIVIEVSDNGNGIAEPMLARIFEQFYRGDESRHDKDGNGLGLYIVKYLVKKMEGTVTAENRNGFTVKIVLPTITEGVT